MRQLLEIAEDARRAKYTVAKLGTNDKNRALLAIADALEARADEIIAANAADIENGRAAGLNDGLIDRLMLDKKRIAGIAEGCRQVAALPDPVGEVLWMRRRPNGLNIGQKRVPMGVIGIIYEAPPERHRRRGGAVLQGRLGLYPARRQGGLPLLDVPDEDHARGARLLRSAGKRHQSRRGYRRARPRLQMMKLNGYLDVLIPRGGAGLIRSVVMNATVPVIETGTGNCHIYVDASADLEMAKNILINAKCQRPSVCNAAESLLVHRDVAAKFLPMAAEGLAGDHVTIHGCARTTEILGDAILPATDEDYGREYLGYEISCKVVDSLDEAIDHINRFNTGHSECIVTRDYDASQRFLEEVDAAAVYVNASTRFTDGGEFGFGAEIGISTQKLHARGPMGLNALTTTKYIIYGNGQVRA